MKAIKLLLAIFPLAAFVPLPAQDHVILVLDGSGSMRANFENGNSRLESAKKSIFSALINMDEETNFGALAFGENADGWVVPLGKLDRVNAWDEINAIRPGGGTPLGEFVKMGADSLLEARKSNFNYGNYRLLVVTDGEATDAKELDRYAGELVGRGLVLNVIGLDMKKDHSLKALANQYVSARNPDALTKAVTSFLAEVPSPAQDSDAEADDVYRYLDAFGNDSSTLAVIEALSVSLGDNDPLGK